jgi:hypothetical protein
MGGTAIVLQAVAVVEAGSYEGNLRYSVRFPLVSGALPILSAPAHRSVFAGYLPP